MASGSALDRGPLAGKRVLLTRPLHQSAELAQALRALGAEAICAPTIAIASPDDERPLQHALDQLASYAWIAFASRNGVDAFFAALARRGTPAGVAPGTKIASIGATTAQALRGYGVRADLVPESFLAGELARALVAAVHRTERVLVVAAQKGRDELPRALADAGIAADVVAAYKTLFADDSEFAQHVAHADVLTFASGSSVGGFVHLLGAAAAARAARERVVACIGPIAAQAARDAGLRVDVVAATHTAQGLLDALRAHFSAAATP